jgi:hypothetical protein
MGIRDLISPDEQLLAHLAGLSPRVRQLLRPRSARTDDVIFRRSQKQERTRERAIHVIEAIVG